MSATPFTLDASDATRADGRWSFAVPRERADALRLYLARRGLAAVVCLAGGTRDARLELPRGAELGPVLAALAAQPDGGGPGL